MNPQKPRLFRCTPRQAILAIVPACLVLAAILSWTFYGFPWDYAPGAWFTVQGDGRGYAIVNKVEPPAASAGLKVGDRIPMRSLDLGSRMVISWTRDGPFWKSLSFQTERASQRRLITIQYRPAPYTWGAMDLYNFFVYTPVILLVLIIGTLLVLLRPSAATWGWYLWSLYVSGSGLGNPWPAVTSGLSFLPVSLHFVITELWVLLAPAGALGLLIFAIYFPDRQPQGLSRVFARTAPYLFAPLALLKLVEDFWWYGCFCNPVKAARPEGTVSPYLQGSSGLMNDVQGWVGIAVVVASTVFLAIHYVRSRGVERQRLQWMAPALALSFVPYIGPTVIGLAMQAAPNIDAAYKVAGPLWDWDSWLQPLFILPSLAVAYTILRHRIYDIEFVLSRTLVYSLFVVAAIGVFSAIDFTFTARFHGSRGELGVDIAVALGLGFWVRVIHGRAINLVDRVLFRRRYDARVRLKATLDAVASAESLPAIEEIVTSGAATALGLASAVFFRRVADGGLLREIGFGWPADAPWHLLPDDRLVALLDKRETWIDLKEIGWARTSLAPPQEPVIAVPMQVAGRLVGVTLYGCRLDGVPSSPDEVRGLVDLAQHAASAYLLLDSVRSGVAARELAMARISR